MLKIIRQFIFLLCFSQTALGTGASSILYKDADRDVPLMDYADLLVDPQSSLTIETILQQPNLPFAPLRGRTLNFGYTDDTFWFRFRLKDIPVDSEKLVILFSYTHLSEVLLYLPQKDGSFEVKKNGRNFRASDLDMPTRWLTFLWQPQTWQDNQYIYMRARTSASAQFKATLMTFGNFSRYDHTMQMIGGLYLGAMLIMAIYNLVFYIMTFDRKYGVYVVYILSSTLLASNLSGYSREYLWPEHPEWNEYALPFSIHLGILTCVWFYLNSLTLLREKTRLRQLAYAFLFVGSLSTLVSLFSPYQLAIGLSMIIMGIGATFCIGLILYFSVLKDRTSRFYLVAYVPLFFVTMIIVLKSLGLLPISIWTEAAPNFGTALQDMLLTFALADQYQQTLLENQRSREKLLAEQSHLLNQLRKIVYPHQVRMILEGSELEATMPTEPGNGCVICFDIIGSSRIQHLNTKRFFRSVFRRCSEIMEEGYNGHEMQATAYRLKEMGDGFLCSVGYPFKPTRHNDSMQHAALELAYRFVRAFQEEVDKLDYPEPIHCGIGIAADVISGFYPESGAKEYDLFSRAIVLATRYESMRREIFKSRPPGNIIILQERLFMSLDSKARQDFRVFDLQSNGVIVRDDPSAIRLYYRIFDSSSLSQSA
jgi:class 3 adenylate cyclase